MTIEMIESRDLRERRECEAKRARWADKLSQWSPGDLVLFVGATGYDKPGRPLTYIGRTGLYCAILQRADGATLSGVEPDRLRRIIGRNCTEYAQSIGYAHGDRVLVVDGKAQIGRKSIDWFLFCDECRRGVWRLPC